MSDSKCETCVYWDRYAYKCENNRTKYDIHPDFAVCMQTKKTMNRLGSCEMYKPTEVGEDVE